MLIDAGMILKEQDINKVFMSNYEKDNKTYQKLIQALDNKRLKYTTPKVNSQYTLGTAEITILALNDKYDNPNDSSIALHPHAETLNTLRTNGAKVYRTDEDGTIIAACKKCKP